MEVLKPSAVESQGYYGGEGLEEDLIGAKNQGRLFGILNGCDYQESASEAPGWSQLITRARDQLVEWSARDEQTASTHFVGWARLSALIENESIQNTGVVVEFG